MKGNGKIKMEKNIMFEKGKEIRRTCLHLALFLGLIISSGACQTEEDIDLFEGEIGESKLGIELGYGNPLVYINEYEERKGVSEESVRAYQRHVGTIAANNIVGDQNKSCSGTLIGPNLFITAGHCYRSNIEEMYIAFDYELTGGEGTPSKTEVFFPIEEMLDYRNLTSSFGRIIDFMLLRLSGNPGNTYGWAAIPDVEDDLTQTDVVVGDTVIIIGHPMENPDNPFIAGHKQISVGEVRDIDHTMDEIPDSLKNNPTIVRYLAYRLIEYDNDTRTHNSGSGVLNTDGVLVGIHVQAPDGDDVPFSDDWYNSAMAMQHIYRYSDVVKSVAQGTLFF